MAINRFHHPTNIKGCFQLKAKETITWVETPHQKTFGDVLGPTYSVFRFEVLFQISISKHPKQMSITTC